MRKFSQICILFALFSCSNNPQEQMINTQAENQLQIPKVRTTTVTQAAIVPEITSFGSVSYRTKADVVCTVDGSIIELLVEEGDEVKKNELLAVLKNTQVQIRYDQALAALGSAKTAHALSKTKLEDSSMQIESKLLSIEKMQMQYDQKVKEYEQQLIKFSDKKELHELGGVSDDELSSMEFALQSSMNDLEIMKQEIEIQSIGFRDSDIIRNGYQVPSDPDEHLNVLKRINTKSLLAEVEVSQSKLESAETEVRSAEQLLSELEIRSPITGIIGAKYLEVGERAKADSKLFTIFDSSDVDIIFPVPESRGILLGVGMSTELTIDALKDQGVLNAEVRHVAPTVDPQSGTITVKAGAPNPKNILRPGMFARVKVAYDVPENVLLIPKTSLIEENDSKGAVYTLINNRIQRINIELGDEYNSSIAVLNGLANEMQIVNNPSPILREGELVEIIQ